MAIINNKTLLNTKTSAKGLPGKSFIHIIDLDFHLRNALCYLSNTKFINYYISSFIKWKFRYKDRLQMTNDLINFLIIYDESRVTVLFNSKLVTRVDMIELISKVDTSIKTYKDLLTIYNEDREKLTYENNLYIYKFKQKWGKFIDGILLSFPYLSKNIKDIQTNLINHYLHFIVKGLMRGRKGVADPSSLNSEAYEVLIDMINSYNIKRSKVPFNSYLVWFIKAGKHRVIKSELWDLKEGSLVSLQEVQENKSKKGKNEITKAIEKYYKKGSKDINYNYLYNYLPKPFKNIICLNYGIIEPLTPAEEIELLIHNVD